jgi:hypothetical protein
VDSRPLLNNLTKLGILIDSKTFEESLNNGDRVSCALLSYSRNDCITCIRSPFPSSNNSLNAIPQYKVTIPEKEVSPINPPGQIVYKNNNCRTNRAFTYQSEYIKTLGKSILKKTSFNSDEFDTFLLVCVLATLNGISSYNKERDNIFILITQNESLLKNRLWIESKFYTIQLNIMSIEEASIFLDLFFKKNGVYKIRGHHTVNKGLWYEYSFRLKIPHFIYNEPIIVALANRMQYALMALDEIGIQYYQGVDLDTQDNTLYHFNYLISLITGIFDNLAIKTNNALKINFPYPAQISLSSSNKSGFLKQVKEKDPVLRKLIQENGPLITLIYLFRELVIHREGLDPLSFHHNSKEGQWGANFIKISKKELNQINLCGDKKSEYDNISKWGVHTVGDDVFLEPYHFSFEVLKMLIPFVDKYLELLHYSSFIEKQQQIDSDFYRTMKVFDENHLGF